MRKAVSYALLALVLASNLGGHAAAQSVQPEAFGETVSEAIDGGSEHYVPEAAVTPRRPAPVAVPLPIASPAVRPALPPRVTPPASVGSVPQKGDAFFRDCPNVWAMGKGPLTRDQPGYRAALDPDGDGIACEPIG